MGGKVALHFAESCARGDYGDFIALPKQLWVLDSVPGEVKSENSDVEVEKVLWTLLVLPSKIPSRKWLVDHMIELGFSKSLSEWIDSNIKKSGDHETWPFNLDGAVLMFNSYGERSYWSLLEHPPKDMEKLLFVPRTAIDVLTGMLQFMFYKKAGHWVHVDNPKGLVEILAPKIASL